MAALPKRKRKRPSNREWLEWIQASRNAQRAGAGWYQRKRFVPHDDQQKFGTMNVRRRINEG